MLLSETSDELVWSLGEGLDGAVGVGARIEASGRTVERWPGSQAVCLVGGPLVSLDMWAVLGPSLLALDATLTAWMHPLAAFSQLACSHPFAGPALIVISQKCQNRIMDMPSRTSRSKI